MLAHAPARPRVPIRFPVERASLLQRGADREGRGLPHRPAADLPGARPRSGSACWSCSCAARRARLRRLAPPGPRRRRGRRGDLGRRPASPRSRCPPSRASAPRTSAWSPRSWAGWARRRRQVAGDRRGVRGRRRRAARRSACGGSGAAGGSPAPPSWSPSASSPPTPARSCSTRCSTTSSRSRRASCAPTCSPLAARGGRRRRPGLRDRRLAPHDGRQRVRERPRARPSASCSTTTLLKDFTPAETRLVVAHELGHVHYHDVRNGLIWLALVAPFGHVGRRRAGRALLARRRARPARRAGRGALARARRARSSPSSPTSSRATSSARADAFSLQLTHDPQTSSASSAGSRSRTSRIPTRPGSCASCSAPTRPRSADRPGGGLRAVKYTVAGGRQDPRRPFADDDAHYRKLLARPRAGRDRRGARRRAARRGASRSARTACCSTPRGRTYDSAGFARWLEERRQAGRDVCFVIGGAFGLALERRDERLSLRPADLPAPARARAAARAALPRAQDPRRRALPSLASRDLRSTTSGRAVQAAAAELKGRRRRRPPEPRAAAKAGFGDYSTNAAMLLAPALGEPPRAIAERLGAALQRRGSARRSRRSRSPAPASSTCSWPTPGTSRRSTACSPPATRYGAGAQGERIQVEFVSANPTGPLTAASGRHAAFGDALARLLELRRQHGRARVLLQRLRRPGAAARASRSGRARAARSRPRTATRATTSPSSPRSIPDAAERPADELAAAGVELLMAGIRDDARALPRALRHLVPRAQRSTRASRAPGSARRAAARGAATPTGTTARCGCARRRSRATRRTARSCAPSGEPTYLAADVAYHWDKLERGFDRLFNVLGSDHHSYVVRLKAISPPRAPTPTGSRCRCCSSCTSSRAASAPRCPSGAATSSRSKS